MTESKERMKLDEVGDWSELKLEILKKYAGAYTKILRGNKLHPIYIDGFAGAGEHISKRTQESIAGSPRNALEIEPPFEEFHFVDLNPKRATNLQKLAGDKDNVYVYSGDSNALLISKIFPRVRYKEYKRALCLLDPYGLHLSWEVIKAAAESKTIEIFLNFPVMDMNMNVLWRRPENVTKENIARMNFSWGDDSWKNAAYKKQETLFGPEDEKQPNEAIAAAFRERLKQVAGFKYVPEPAPMRNSTSAVVYYLFFAAQQPTAANIVTDILNNYRKLGKLHG